MENKLFYATTDRLDRTNLIHLYPQKIFNGIKVQCGKTMGRYRLWVTHPPQGEVCQKCLEACPRETLLFKHEATRPGQIWLAEACEYIFDGQTWRGPFEVPLEPPPPGEKMGLRLTSEQVREIRALYARGNYSQRALAAKFEVSCPTICHILNRKLWRNV